MPGNSIYTIKFAPNVIRRDIPELSSSAKALIKRAIEERLKTAPLEFGKPLRYSFKGARRLRIADYRVIYLVNQDKLEVIILAIQHRSVVYTN
ncbi:MAG TPA: type II toxin-antitoxin system RelE/ParE family toxin [Candidatus Nitrosotenuis sp.]|jgi:mRNA-degrading endonuclease RelE of RelBE toxin-antitoxin system|nr:type II toxin-antitoxin system RelE/ParE family toxin [Candidatus Nitrosotenuis sp.]